MNKQTNKTHTHTHTHTHTQTMLTQRITTTTTTIKSFKKQTKYHALQHKVIEWMNQMDARATTFIRDTHHAPQFLPLRYRVRRVTQLVKVEKSQLRTYKWDNGIYVCVCVRIPSNTPKHPPQNNWYPKRTKTLHFQRYRGFSWFQLGYHCGANYEPGQNASNTTYKTWKVCRTRQQVLYGEVEGAWTVWDSYSAKTFRCFKCQPWMCRVCYKNDVAFEFHKMTCLWLVLKKK